jgi:hypothetical protein
MPTIAVLWLLIGVHSICVILLRFYVVRNKKKIEELQEQLDDKDEKVEDIKYRLVEVEDLTVNNQALRLLLVEDLVCRVQLGSSDISIQKEILPNLRKVCEECDTRYVKHRVGAQLKKIRGYVKARTNGGQRENIIDEIEDISDEFDIDSNTVLHRAHIKARHRF